MKYWDCVCLRFLYCLGVEHADQPDSEMLVRMHNHLLQLHHCLHLKLPRPTHLHEHRPLLHPCQEACGHVQRL